MKKKPMIRKASEIWDTPSPVIIRALSGGGIENAHKNVLLRHLKQLKSEMGKTKKQFEKDGLPIAGITICMEMIDKKIKKIEDQ